MIKIRVIKTFETIEDDSQDKTKKKFACHWVDCDDFDGCNSCPLNCVSGKLTEEETLNVLKGGNNEL